ncbi:flagellin [Paenibacillus odorifer]|jgi:flagellin|uniref:flagellin N-terminal helical domain-containing protein n=1 Tax=Paenibacillus TaxID=44249 RepID=UPI00096FEBE7|nr:MULTISPECIES: flagellin [Paenibacillus]MDH6428695.1 flagellin [Paenibacillus sp. PastH-4]MDH6444897.1 flagellin [Paenibacillus sp. PastF-4]MDH6528790.1 flagellin [Paenibacillus sp. PastH-3]OMD68532.1 flagellin [Paenibacillus odorifer]OME09021.1 flagellin [Paenibacillus odorifer]
MIINHNIAALNTHRQLSTNTTNTNKSIEKLSSGLRINRAGDDAAGLSISEKMRGQIRGLEQSSRNAQDGISLIQTAEGSLNEVHSITQRMRELAVQSANDTNVAADRTSLQDEYDALATEIGRINTDTEFNTQKLLNGTAGATGKVQIHVGANKDQKIELDLSLDGIKLDQITTDLKAGKINTQADAETTIKLLDDNIVKVSTGRSKLGALQNRLEHSIANVDNAAENLTAAESRVRDVDMAKEMMNQTKNSILAQAAQAMLAQANQQPQGVLQLLR